LRTARWLAEETQLTHDETGAIDSPGPSNASALARALGASEADAVRVAIAEDLL